MGLNQIISHTRVDKAADLMAEGEVTLTAGVDIPASRISKMNF
jgi:hypothetical protein